MEIDRHMDGQNGTENPEIGPHKYVQVIVDNNMQSNSTGERQTFQQKVLEQMD